MATSSKSTAIFSPSSVPFISGLIGVTLALLIIWLGAYPQVVRLLEGGDLSIDTQASVLAQRSAYLTKLQSVKQLSDEINAQVGRGVNGVLPNHEDVPTLFALYEGVAKELGVQLGAVGIEGSTNASADPGLGVLDVSLRMTGVEYPAFKNFLRGIEGLQRISDVRSFGYDPAASELSVGLSVYYQK